MKKSKFLTVFIAFFLLSCSSVFAIEETKSNSNIQQIDSALEVINPEQVYETPILLDDEQHINIVPQEPNSKAKEPTLTFYERISNSAKEIYKLNVTDTSKVDPLLKEALTWEFENSFIEKVHLWSIFSPETEFDFEDGHNTNTYGLGFVNAFIDGEFKGGKEEFRVMMSYLPVDGKPYMQTFFRDLYIQSSRIPHHKILIGQSRTGIGIEGAQSAYTLPFQNRSQIARKFANSRKVGLRVRGDYSLVNYDTGIYSSNTYFSDFFSGAEFDVWGHIKPFGKTDGKYGQLLIGGGISSGKRHDTSYFLSGADISYEYKRFWVRAEYQNANGSNGNDGLTRAQRQGWNATVGYYVTPKFELVARYDEFDPDKNVGHNNQREYSAGFNYYIKGPALMLNMNYVFCQNQSLPNSHRFLIGTQIAL